MKATGVIRRIDDLGRIVIPKEIRTKMHIEPSDYLEIFTDEEGVYLRKYNPIDVSKWETAKNIIRHLLKDGFRLTNSKKETMSIEESNFIWDDGTETPIDSIGYLRTPKGKYSKDEIAAAVKIATEILLS